ncbi:helix-turn-helix transcriptional regulator [Acetobacter malorum]|uniref:AraC family transcriptional regulator n=1 Tax=Acetobacter malorum TaxID=178901 RepID=UPI0039ED1A99
MHDVRSSLIHRPQPAHLAGRSLLHPVFSQLHNGLSAGLFSSALPTTLRGEMDDCPAVLRCSIILSGQCEITLAGKAYEFRARDVATAYLPSTQFQIATSADFSCLEVHITPTLLQEMNTPLPWGETDASAQNPFFSTLKANASLHKAATGLCQSLQKNQHNGPLCCAAALTILGQSFEQIDAAPQDMPLSRHERACLHRACAFLLARTDKAPTILELARYSGLSATRLKMGFRILFGCGPYSLFQSHRMEHAKKLLKTHSVTETAMELGYSNMSHFSAAFKKQIGKAPHLYRKEG